jgi:hypothetical protein
VAVGYTVPVTGATRTRTTLPVEDGGLTAGRMATRPVHVFAAAMLAVEDEKPVVTAGVDHRDLAAAHLAAPVSSGSAGPSSDGPVWLAAATLRTRRTRGRWDAPVGLRTGTRSLTGCLGRLALARALLCLLLEVTASLPLRLFQDS